MSNIVDMLGLQNSLNFQEEKDKESVALYGSHEVERALVDPGSELEQSLKPFVRCPSRTAVQRELPNALQFKADLLGKTDESHEALPTMAHVDLERRCQVCQQESTARHVTVKAMRLACLKYRSGQVRHWGKPHDRMALIKVQSKLVEEHSKQIKAIMAAKTAMEKTRDVHSQEAEVKQYSIRLQDYGGLRDSGLHSLESDGGVSGGMKPKNEGMSPDYGEGKRDQRWRVMTQLPRNDDQYRVEEFNPDLSTEQRMSRTSELIQSTPHQSAERASGGGI